MNGAKQKKQLLILAALGLVLAVSLYRTLRTTTPAVPISARGDQPSVKLPTASSQLVIERGRGTGKKSIDLMEADPTIHLKKLSESDSGSPLNARNMFSFEAAAMASSALRPSQRATSSRRSSAGLEESAPASVSTGPASGSQPPPPVIINLKFYGVKTDPFHKKREGFFSEGDDTFLAGEGEVVANRYRVVRVGDSSAEIEDINSKTRRQLPLATQ